MAFGEKREGPAATWAPGTLSFSVRAEAQSHLSVRGVQKFKFISSVLEKVTLGPGSLSSKYRQDYECGPRPQKALGTHTHTHRLWPPLPIQVCVLSGPWCSWVSAPVCSLLHPAAKMKALPGQIQFVGLGHEGPILILSLRFHLLPGTAPEM